MKNRFIQVSLDLLRQGIGIKFRAAGGSMYPAIQEGDLVTVMPFDSKIAGEGDVIVFVCESRFVVHRLIRVLGNSFVARGDALPKEEMVAPKEVVGQVMAVSRNGLAVNFKKRSLLMHWWGRASIPSRFFRRIARS